MRSYAAGGTVAICIVLSVLTLLSIAPGDAWWVRIFDFTRFHLLFATGVAALAYLLIRPDRWALLLALLGLTAAIQAWRLYPYLGFAPVEVAMAATETPAAACFTLLGLNVHQQNRDIGATVRLLEAERPDILLLMETDRRWTTALAQVLNEYPVRVIRPLDNTYGLVFATRLPVSWWNTVDVTDQNTPTVYARLATRDGREFGFIGLHPRPPRPGQDTDRRDRKIKRAAELGASMGLPILAMGDFNDVPWSETTERFRMAGDLRDPRIGRGHYATFPSRYLAVGWPLDQLFLSPELTIGSVDVGKPVGSDHRPLTARVCLPENVRHRRAAVDTGGVS